MKPEKRARRRGDLACAKQKAKRHLHATHAVLTPHPEITERQVGIATNTPARCSCFMCGNRRKYDKHDRGMTKQEVLAEQSMKES
jgi:hypothetical protein